MADIRDRPGRGAVIVDDQGGTKPVGWWTENFDADQKSTWLQTLRRSFSEAMLPAQRLHLQRDALKMARIRGEKPHPLPAPEVRRNVAQRELAQINAVRERVNRVECETFDQKLALHAFEYPKHDAAGAALRGELRSQLRGASLEKQRELLRKPEYVAAALEGPPELSGLTDIMHKGMKERAIAEKYPEVVKHIDLTNAAAELVGRALDAAEKSVRAELAAAGETPAVVVVEPWA